MVSRRNSILVTLWTKTFTNSAEKRKELGIKELPTTLKESLYELKSDEVLKRTLGSHIFDAFIDLKTNDWNQYCLYVSPWEIMKYLDY
jgi:glutamine synthetase